MGAFCDARMLQLAVDGLYNSVLNSHNFMYDTCTPIACKCAVSNCDNIKLTSLDANNKYV